MPFLTLAEARGVIASLWLYRGVVNRKESVEVVKLQKQQEEVRMLEIQLQNAKALVARTEHQVSYWQDESERTQKQIASIQEKVCLESGCPIADRGGHSYHGALCAPRSGPPVWGRTALFGQEESAPGQSVPIEDGGAGGSSPSFPAPTGFPPP